MDVYFAPGVVDSVYQEVACFLRFGPATQTAGGYSLRLDLLRRGAGSTLQMGGPRPEVFAVAMCLSDAAVTRPGISPAIAGVRGGLVVDSRGVCRRGSTGCFRGDSCGCEVGQR